MTYNIEIKKKNIRNGICKRPEKKGHDIKHENDRV